MHSADSAQVMPMVSSARRTVRPHGVDAHSCIRAVFLSNVYPVEFNAGNRKRVYSSMAFAGTVVGQLTFGASATIDHAI